MNVEDLIDQSEPCGNCGTELGAHQQPQYCPHWSPFPTDQHETRRKMKMRARVAVYNLLDADPDADYATIADRAIDAALTVEIQP